MCLLWARPFAKFFQYNIPFSSPSQPRREVFSSSYFKWGNGSLSLRSLSREELSRDPKVGPTDCRALLLVVSIHGLWKQTTWAGLPPLRPRGYSLDILKRETQGQVFWFLAAPVEFPLWGGRAKWNTIGSKRVFQPLHLFNKCLLRPCYASSMVPGTECWVQNQFLWEGRLRVSIPGFFSLNLCRTRMLSKEKPFLVLE